MPYGMNWYLYRNIAQQITINEGQIKKEILKNKKKQSKEYQLSEITFEVT